MNASDLMIGDWVLYMGKPHYIIAMESDGMVKITTPELADGWCRATWTDRMEPIPLTPGILEKNGFYLNGSNKDGDISVDIDYGKWCYENEDGFDVVGDGQDIKYVHQLQHALRLCGIKKEITI